MKRSFLITLLAGALAYALLPLPGESAPLQKRIDEKRAQVAKERRREGVLTQTISGYTNRIRGLEGRVRESRGRLRTVQRSLNGSPLELLEARDEAEVARDRLERARRELQTARKLLAARLVAMYKADQPDVLTVILSADGFSDLLERTEYLERISYQDRRIFGRVRVLKARAQTPQRPAHRDRAAGAGGGRADPPAARRHRRDEAPTSRRTRATSARRARRSARRSRRCAHREARGDGGPRVARARAGARRGILVAAPGPVRRGSGRMIWPVNGPITGAFGEARPGHMHAGIDISAPTGTPIRAADSGRVALAGWTGGYGKYTCIAHGGGLSTCYAHQSRIGVSVGQSVGQGR